MKDLGARRRGRARGSSGPTGRCRCSPRSASASRRSSRSRGYRISACLHVTTETANLVRTLKAGGADVVLCASNPLSTQDDVAAALVDEYGIAVFAIKGEDNDTYYQHIEAAVDHKPAAHDGRRRRRDRRPPLAPARAARRRHRAAPRRRRPASSACARWSATARSASRSIAVNDARHEAPLRQPLRHRPVHDRRHHPRHERPARRQARSSSPATAGAGAASPCGPSGMGAHVIVTEVDPLRALEAAMDGFQVMPMERAAAIGDIFITVTGDKRVIAPRAHRADEGRRHPRQLGPLQRRDRHPGAAPAGDGERARRAPFVEEFTLADGRAHLPAGRGPADQPGRGRGPSRRRSWTCPSPTRRCRPSTSCRTRARSSGRSTPCRRRSTRRSPGSSSRRWASTIDTLTDEQAKYLESWDEGT